MKSPVKSQVDAMYTPEELAEFQEMAQVLDRYNRSLERWNDTDGSSPRPQDPGYSKERMARLRRYQSLKMEEKLGYPISLPRLP